MKLAINKSNSIRQQLRESVMLINLAEYRAYEMQYIVKGNLITYDFAYIKHILHKLVTTKYRHITLINDFVRFINIRIECVDCLL